MAEIGFAPRLKLIAVVLVLVGVLVVYRLGSLQFGPEGDWLKEKAETLDQRVKEFVPARGQIFDRNGELLAGNDTHYILSFSPRAIREKDELALFVSAMLGLPADVVLGKASLDPAVNLYVPLTRGVPADLAWRIEAEGETQGIDLSGLDMEPEPHRNYPGGSLASQVLGFVAHDDAGKLTGYYGVEEYYNEVLAGKSISAVKHVVPFDVDLDPTPPGGQDLFLTIDRTIQLETERVLAEGLKETGAASGLILIMDPKTGEILAMAAQPAFDPNSYLDSPDTSYANPAASAQYEPGSVFKVLTMAAALDSGTVAPTTPFLDTGYVEVGGAVIRNWDGGAWGPQDMTGCMQHSLNVCLASVASWMGPKTFYNYMTAFGIGHTTNVDLAGETPGRLKTPGDPDWYDSDLGTNSFGQGVAVTPVQLLTAISSVANGGAMMQPHLLRQVKGEDALHTTQPQVLGRPIRPETAAALTEMLSGSLEREASGALVPGYRIAGKTGTAQIPVPGGYDAEATIGSFVGWGPVDDPRFLVLIKLDRPLSSPWGSTTAAPLFGKLASRLVVLLEIPPDDVRRGLGGQ